MKDQYFRKMCSQIFSYQHLKFRLYKALVTFNAAEENYFVFKKNSALNWFQTFRIMFAL